MQTCHSRSRSSSITDRKLSITAIETPSYNRNSLLKSGTILNTHGDPTVFKIFCWVSVSI